MEVDPRLNPDAKLAGIHRIHGIPSRTCPTADRRLPSAIEMDRANVRRVVTIIVARECSPVSDSYDDEVRSDDLYDATVSYPKLWYVKKIEVRTWVCASICKKIY
jgi:hypothetical protein